jgi:hypothetical protein
LEEMTPVRRTKAKKWREYFLTTDVDMVRDAATQQNGALDLSEDIVTMWQDFFGPQGGRGSRWPQPASVVMLR